jgi:hypothetical protein
MQQIINKYPQLKNVSNPYIFLKQELDFISHDNEGINYNKYDNFQSYKKLKNGGFIRHCKPLKNGKLYDYIVNKEYDTIQDWIASYNPITNVKFERPTLKDVCYGRNRQLYPGTFDTNYVMPFPDDKVVPTMDTSRLQDLAEHLHSKNMNEDSVMVNFNGLIMPLNTFMKL